MEGKANRSGIRLEVNYPQRTPLSSSNMGCSMGGIYLPVSVCGEQDNARCDVLSDRSPTNIEMLEGHKIYPAGHSQDIQTTWLKRSGQH